MPRRAVRGVLSVVVLGAAIGSLPAAGQGPGPAPGTAVLWRGPAPGTAVPSRGPAPGTAVLSRGPAPGTAVPSRGADTGARSRAHAQEVELDARLPAPPDRGGETRRAVLLEDAVLREEADGSSAAAARLPAGTVLPWIGEVTDSFGRTWTRVRDPTTLRRRNERLVAPFDAAAFRSFGGDAAFLEVPPLPQPAPVAPAGRQAPPPAAPPGPPWWRRVVVAGPENMPTFGGTRAVDGLILPDEVAREALELVGGIEALGTPPLDPVAGQLWVPDPLPLVFRFDGAAWRLMEPVRYLGVAPGLLGNPLLQIDLEAPERVVGPPVGCWELLRALDGRGTAVGAVGPAPPLRPATGAAGAGGGTGAGGVAGAGSPGGPGGGRSGPVTDFRPLVWPTTPLTLAMPPRVLTATPAGGVTVRDSTHETAVNLAQELPAAMVERLRGSRVRLEVVARAAPRTAPAAVGMAVQIDGEPVSGGGSVGEEPTALTLEASVPGNATTISVHLLPLDFSLALEQQGAVIFESATLQPAHWPTTFRSGILVLHQVEVISFPGAERFTRAPVAVTRRSPEEIAAVWPEVQAAGLDEAQRRGVLAGEVRRGMSPRLVRMAWGEPQRVDESDPSGGSFTWIWPDRSAVFADARLLSFTVTPAAAEGTGSTLCFTPPEPAVESGAALAPGPATPRPPILPPADGG